MNSSDGSDSDSEEVVAMYYIWKKLQRNRRNMWVREILLHREQLGEFHQLVPQVEEKFYNYYRMQKKSYDLLVSKVKPLFASGSTNCRKTISFEERLTVTLRYLATGDSFHSASFRFRISHNIISVIIHKILGIIYDALVDTYLVFPDREGFQKIADDFYKKKKFPNCVGAIDGKHVRISKPFNCGSLYYNYKLYHSIILLAVVDVHNKFIMIDVGSYGKNSDGGVLEHSKFGQSLYSKKINLPEPKIIDQYSKEPLPYIFVGDEGFRLSENLMKPYPRQDLTVEKRRYNYHLSNTRQTVECTFGNLVAKFRVFQNCITVHPDKVDKIIKAACVLHNMLKVEEQKSNDSDIFENNTVGSALESISNIRRSTTNNQSTLAAREIRNKFCAYFSGVNAVE